MKGIFSRSFLCIIFILTAAVNRAQQYDCNCNTTTVTDGKKTPNTLVFKEYHNPISNYRGGQFLNSWTKGAVTLVNGENVVDMMLRYDMFSDELLWLRETDFLTGVVNKLTVMGFQIYGSDSGLTFVKRRIKPPGNDTIVSYLQVLAPGELELLVYRNKVKAVSESRTVDNTIYYIFTDINNFNSVRLNRRSLINTPGIDRERMKNVIRENKLSLKNELNFTRAVYLYNQTGL